MCINCSNMSRPPFFRAKPGSAEAYRGICCRNCGDPLKRGEGFYQSHGKPYCRGCIENASADDLVRFCETTWDEWLSGMGIEAVSVPLGRSIGG